MGSMSHEKKLLQLVFILVLLNQSVQTLTTSTSTSTTVSSTSSTTTAGLERIENENDDGDSTTAKNNDKSELLEIAETKDPQKLEIVKQIRKYNNDGSYTVGYEAEDGTFKIESRDVLGNVKGTYGYVDENGEIRRVSYTANNGTSLKTGSTASDEQVTPATHRINRTSLPLVSSTRRPYSSAYGSSTNSPTRSSVIQSIPRRRILFPSSTERPSRYYDTTTHGPTTTVVYATSYHTSARPTMIVRPTSHPSGTQKTVEQIARPDKQEAERLSPVYIASTKEVSKIESSEKGDEKKPARGNNLRRQLNTQQGGGEQYEQPQRHIIYSQSAGADSSLIYGANSGTTRQSFTTTSSPRVPVTVLAARQRAAQIQNLIANSPTSTTEKSTYAKASRRPETTARTTDHTTESTSEHYLTQSPVPIVQIPANQRDVNEAAGDERRLYRQRPLSASILNDQLRGRESQRYFGSTQSPAVNQRSPYRFPPPPPPYDQQYRQDNEQYLREITPSPVRGSSTVSPVQEQSEHSPEPFRAQRRPAPSQVPAQYDQQQDNGYPQGQQSYPIPYPINPYRNQYQSPYYPDYPDRPLTTRDFERLLQILVLRHQQLQTLSYRLGGGGYAPTTVNPYYQGPSQYPPSYGGANVAPYGGYQQIPRPPFDAGVYYDPRYAYSPSQPQQVRQQYQNPETGYQPQNPIPSAQENIYDAQRIAPRRYGNPRDNPVGLASTPYPRDQEYATAQNHQQLDYLPSDVREQLLYRMLMLAIQAEDAADHVPSPTETHSTTTPIPKYFKKPVRSVQILGEE